VKVLEWDRWNSTVLTTTTTTKILCRWGWYSSKVLYWYVGCFRFKSQMINRASCTMFFRCFSRYRWPTAEKLRVFIPIMSLSFPSKSFPAHHPLIFLTSKSLPVCHFRIILPYKCFPVFRPQSSCHANSIWGDDNLIK